MKNKWEFEKDLEGNGLYALRNTTVFSKPIVMNMEPRKCKSRHYCYTSLPCKNPQFQSAVCSKITLANLHMSVEVKGCCEMVGYEAEHLNVTEDPPRVQKHSRCS